MGFHLSRVIEVYAESPTGSGRVGSGYRVTATAVLTAGHVVAGPLATECEVRPLGEQKWIRGSVQWRDDSADVALIGLPPDAPPPAPDSPMPQWGAVAGGADAG